MEGAKVVNVAQFMDEKVSKRAAEINYLKNEMGIEFFGLAIINHDYDVTSGIHGTQTASLGDAKLI